MCWPSIRHHSSRAIVFRGDISIAATAQQEFRSISGVGLVEHEPEDIWTSTIATCREALKKAGIGAKDGRAIASQPARNHRGVGPRHR